MKAVLSPEHTLLACHECDLLQYKPKAPPGTVVRCRRCNGELYRHTDKSLDHAIAWSLCGLILLVLANVFPVLNLAAGGYETEASLLSGAVALYREGKLVVATLVVGILIIAPTLLFLLQIVVLWPLRHNRLVIGFVPFTRLLSRLNHWLMFDVFMLAIIVAVVKLSSLAQVAPGAGLWAFLGLMIASIASVTSYDLHLVWDRYTELTRSRLPAVAKHDEPEGETPAAHLRRTALSQGMISCPVCGLLCRQHSEDGEHHCPRCASSVPPRKTDSLTRTWALLVAGYVLFIPANLLPITITSSLFGIQADTIMSGVAYFWREGAYDLAIIIFTASIFVPMAKLLALTFLAYTAQKRTTWEPLQRTRLFRMVEFIGKWSMLDIFVVALMARLVQFSSLASFEAGPGAIAFATVVVTTIFAAMSFDSRLLWDPLERDRHLGGKRD